MGEVTIYNDYVDLANQEYNNVLTNATEDNLFSKIAESGQRNQLARYYYNKTGLNISDSNRIVIAPKNGYMIQRLSYIDNDLIGGAKSGIQALNIDTSNEGEIVLRNKGAVGQVKLVYVFHSLAYALGIKIDVSKVDIFPVLNEALHDFEFLYFAPLNIARSVTSENIDFIDVLFIAYNFRTYFDKVLLQSLANAMFNAGWFEQSWSHQVDVSNIPLNTNINFTDYIFDSFNVSYIASEIIEYVNNPNYFKLDSAHEQYRNLYASNIVNFINSTLSPMAKYGIGHNYPYEVSVACYNTNVLTIKITLASGEGHLRFTAKNNENTLIGYSSSGSAGHIYITSVLDSGSTYGENTMYYNIDKHSFESAVSPYYSNYTEEPFIGGNDMLVTGSQPLYTLIISNVGNHYQPVGVEGITIIDNAVLPTGIDSLDTDYPDWVALLENWTSTGIDWVSEKLKNVFKIISFLPLNLITNGVTYPEQDYTPLEVETNEVLLPEIIPPQRPNKVINTLTLIPDEDDTVEDPEDPKTYEPIIDPKHPEKYPPTNKYYYDIDVEINYPKDFIDPIGGTKDNPTNPIEPPSKNNGNISIPPKNPTDSITSSKLFTVYNPTADQIDALGGYLWGESIAGTLASIFTNPLNAIISLHCIYCEPDVIGTKEIRLGYLASGVSAKYVVSQYKEVDCGTIRIPEYYGDCRDYSPYTSINLFLPFIGFRPIKVDDVMGSELSIKYFVDVYTGTCLACVSVNKGGVIQLTYTFDGNCAVMLPLTAGSWANMTVGLATALTSMIVNPVAGALQLPNAVHNGISMSSQGQLGCNAGAMGRKKPYVVITNTQAYDAVGYNELYGYPANILTKLSQLEGYTKVKEVHVENVNNATVDEKNEIERLLKSGVIIS